MKKYRNTNNEKVRVLTVKKSLVRISVIYTAHRWETILIIRKGWKVPLITDATGKVDGNFYFRFGENTSVYRSCSILYRNEFLVFGGTTDYGGDKRQISMISGCQLQRIGSLAFDHNFGACTGVNDETIYLCFDYNQSQKCRYASSPLDTFLLAAESEHRHSKTSIASSDCE